MIPQFPVIELFDRLIIARIKWARTRANHAELEFYEKQIRQYDIMLITDLLEKLDAIHNDIWELEKELKSGRDQNLSLAEIGQRAIDIRDLNNQRIVVKNLIAEKLQDHVFEIKREHLSE